MRNMLVILATVLGVSCFSTFSQAQTLPDAAIRSVIDQQIEAFEADDFAKAFTFASPSIQQLFGGPERFGAMVRNGYPMVWRPGSVRYGELREISGVLWQKVIIQDASGVSHVLDYRMVQVDGTWRISAVQILPAPDVAA